MSRSQMAVQEAGTSMNAWRALLGRQVALVRDRYGYKVNGRYFRRVTTLLDGIPKPALTSWAARTVAEFAVEHKDSWLSLPRTDAVKLLKGCPWHPVNYTTRLWHVFRAAAFTKRWLLDTNAYNRTPRERVFGEPVGITPAASAAA